MVIKQDARNQGTIGSGAGPETPLANAAGSQSTNPGNASSTKAEQGADFFTASPMQAKRAGNIPKFESKYAPPTVMLTPADPNEQTEAELDLSDKPKVARPRGYQPKGARDSQGDLQAAITSVDPAAQHLQVQESSFFDQTDRKTHKPTVKGTKKAAAEESEKKERREKSMIAFLQKPVTVGGASWPLLNVAITGLMLASTLFMIYTLAPSLMEKMPSVGQENSMRAAYPNLAGTWKFGYLSRGDKKPTEAAVEMRDDNFHLTGNGEDKAGKFTLEGDVTFPSTVALKKLYVGQDPRNPIILNGTFVSNTFTPVAKGSWHFNRFVVKFSKKFSVIEQGTWTAEVFPDPHPQPPPNLNLVKLFFDLPMHQKLMIGAGFCIFLITTMLGTSFYLFSPGGWLNVREKKKYIPSQVKAEHDGMVRELSKPLKPGGLPLGQRCEWRSWLPLEAKDLSITPGIRVHSPHVLILGGTDKGKSRLMANMIAHDIRSNERAVVVIDSDGGLIDLIVRWIASRANNTELGERVVYFDPSLKGNQRGYNPLEMPEDDDLQTAASSIVHGFKAIYTEQPGSQSQWTQQTANILRNAIMLLMVNGKSLADLPAVLNDNDFRDIMLESVEKRRDERAEFITLLDSWGQYKKLARSEQWISWVEPILNRVTPMLGDARIRSVLTKPGGDINLRKIIEEKKILLLRLPKSQLDQNANLLGSLIVTGLKQAALSLAAERSSKQNPVALYLDEFDTFIEKETLERITSETDKFKIGFIGCVKTLQHLPEEMRNQLLLGVGTLACFALTKKDADMLGPQMFRVDGRKPKHTTLTNWLNQVNTSPLFEQVSDEEKLNVDRIIGQKDRTFFCYRLGTVAGVFHLKAHDFKDIPDSQVKQAVIDKMCKLPKKTDGGKD